MTIAKKSILASILIGTAISIAFPLAKTASASSETKTSIIDRIVSKFNLDRSGVEDVFDEARDLRRSKIEQQLESKLDKSVANGLITEAQKSLIMAKHEELQRERDAHRDEWRNLTKEQRSEEMKERRASIDAWIKENGIPDGIFGIGKGYGEFGHRNNKGRCMSNQ